MAFAKAQPICTFCRNLNYADDVFYIRSFPQIADICCVCGKKRDKIGYMRLDPMKVHFPKVRRTTPREKGTNVRRHHR